MGLSLNDTIVPNALLARKSPLNTRPRERKRGKSGKEARNLVDCLVLSVLRLDLSMISGFGSGYQSTGSCTCLDETQPALKHFVNQAVALILVAPSTKCGCTHISRSIILDNGS
jgi:hypothetical protein